MFGLTSAELKILQKLNTPQKVQDFLDRLPINFEEKGETLMSPRRVLRERKAHCIEGAMLAALAFWLQGRPPLLLDFKTIPSDEGHVVAPFKTAGGWGAVSKTNHGILRWREPIYRNIRELALSYFHEYYDFKSGIKTMRSYTKPFNLSQLGDHWVTAETDLWSLDRRLERQPHYTIATPAQIKRFRPAGRTEIAAGRITEWPPKKASV